jgi:hypothetical protein
MNDTAQDVVTETVCTQCGTPADPGLIFCKKCGATLRPPVPLTPSVAKDDLNPRRIFGIKGILLVFALCAAFDFGWGYFHQRSIPAGVIGVIGGLFGTAFYLLAMRPWKR